MQQIPKRNTMMAKYLRSVFVAPAKKVWVNADWSQFEFRVFAHYTNDETLLKVYEDNPDVDYHQALTDIINLAYLNRDKVKRINLGLVFGMGEGKLAKECKLPYTITTFKNGKKGLAAGPEAKGIFADYHARFPGAKMVLNRATALAKARGYVKTISGRRIRFAGPQYTYKAGGSVFQGTSADIMKAKKNELVRKYYGTDVDLILLVHDEFNLLAPRDMDQQVAEEVREILQDVPQLRVPVRAKVGTGPNWWQAGENQK
jgi:DNA polymerase-1